MASQEHVRMVKHLDLLVSGAFTSLRGIFNREVNSRSQPLEVLLSENRFRLHGIHREQFLQLFPPHSAVNAEIATWSIPLLLSVVKVLFWSSLSPRERSCINTFTLYLADIREHPDEISLMEGDYNTRRADLRAALQDLSVSFEEDTKKEIRDIINRNSKADFDIKPAICRVRELCEFTNDVLDALEQRFAENYPEKRNTMLTDFSLY